MTELGRMYVTILIHTHRLSWPIGSQFRGGGGGVGSETIQRGWHVCPGMSGEGDVVPGHSGIGGGGQLNGELTALTTTREDWLETGSGDENKSLLMRNICLPHPIQGHRVWSGGKLR